MTRSTILTLALTCSAIGACRRSSEPVAVTEHPDMQADNVIQNVRQWMTRDGVRHALLTADTAYVFQDSSRADLRHVHVTMYDDNGAQSGELTSTTGTLDTRSEAMTARGNVILTLAAGAREIRTEELHYDPQGGRIWSDVQTTSVEKGTTVVGTGFSAETGPSGELKNVQVRNPRATGKGVEITF